MKENKTEWVKARVTPTEKQIILNYCERHSLKVAAFLRQVIQECLEKEED